MSSPPSHGPLAGIKVLELGQLIAGPFAGKMFAEFGASVIKIEPPPEGDNPGGDPLRQWRLLHHGTSLWWYVQARNKKSVTANLRMPEGQEIVRRLARDADIVIENFRPGTLEKWGLGYDALAAATPGLILRRLSGFGQTGPYRDQPGFGAVGESMGGMRHVTGFPERPPVRMNISIGDALAALHGVIGVLMALHHRNAHGGKGQVVDVALYEAVFNMMESLIPDYDLHGDIRGRIGTGLTNIVPSNPYKTRDRHIGVTPFGRRQLRPTYATRNEILMVVADHAEKCVVGLDDPAVELPDKDANDVGVDQPSDSQRTRPQPLAQPQRYDQEPQR